MVQILRDTSYFSTTDETLLIIGVHSALALLLPQPTSGYIPNVPPRIGSECYRHSSYRNGSTPMILPMANSLNPMCLEVTRYFGECVTDGVQVEARTWRPFQARTWTNTSLRLNKIDKLNLGRATPVVLDLEMTARKRKGKVVEARSN
ncbi:unnamed protein product [Dovyalis caffra]|uniref:Uncharacterized protein n=1 Tax=Dovyalis caffra TaxID=77055 RepID=A0AAV1RF58_9ROSI|nr:unnamed protein product [Dovyalis caffra]